MMCCCFLLLLLALLSSLRVLGRAPAALLRVDHGKKGVYESRQHRSKSVGRSNQINQGVVWWSKQEQGTSLAHHLSSFPRKM
jgi:hypothetical protein